MIFAVMMLMSTAAFAGSFSFTKVSEVKQVGKTFFAYTASGESLEISALQFKQISNADGFFILNVDGEKVIAAGDEFEIKELKVEKVSLSEGKPEVFFNDGSSKVFTKDDWLTSEGQTVRLLTIDTPTWRHTRYSALADGATVEQHAKTAPVKKAAAPTTPVTQAAPAAQAAPVAPAAPAAQAAPAAPARSNSPVKFTIE